MLEHVITLKSKHPVHYWIRILCFAFSIVFIALWVMPDNTKASDVSIFNISDETSISSYNLDFSHTKDDYTVTTFQDDEDNLYLGYRKPEGTWNYTEIAPSNYLSNAAGWAVGGIVITSNNSVIVYAWFSPSGTPTSCLWISYGDQNFSDPWTYFVVLTGANANAYEIAINDTDQVCLLSRAAGAVYAGIYDFPNNVMDHGMASWNTGSNLWGSVCSNKSGTFWIASGPGASATPATVRDYDKTESAISFTSGYQQYNGEIACLENDHLVVAWVYKNGPNGVLKLSIQATVPLGGFWQHSLSVVVGQTFAYTPSISVHQNSSSFAVGGYAFNNDNFYKYYGAWDDDQATWQASETILFNDPIQDQSVGGSNSIWPRYNETSFCQPTSGWVFLCHKADTDQTLYLIFDNLNWTGDMTYVAPEPEPDPDPDPEDPGDGSEICATSWIYVAVFCLVIFGTLGVIFNSYL